MCMFMYIRYVHKLQVHVSASTRTILRILPRPLLFELMGGKLFAILPKKRGCQVIPMFSSIMKVLVVVGTTLIY